MKPSIQTLTRVRHTNGALGWHNSKGEIFPDSEPSLRLLAYWMRNSQENQDDFGVPAEGWGTAWGYWLPVGERHD